MKTATLLALLAVTPTLAGCDIIDIFTGKKTKGQIAYENQQASIATQAEMHAHNQALLATIGSVPLDTPPEAQQVAEAPPAVTPEPIDPGPPPFVCQTIWRQQTCDEGVLYMLDSNGNWILPGRTE